MHYHVDRPGELAKAPSRHGSQAPPDAVAIHGSSQHLADSVFGASFTTWRVVHVSRKVLVPEARLHGNALPSPGAAPGQNSFSALGLHSRAKTVRLGTATTVRLKRALGH